jgi:hypothetical protein
LILTENVEAFCAAGGTPFIAPKSNTKGGVSGLFEKMFHYYQFRRKEFLRAYRAEQRRVGLLDDEAEVRG